MPKPTEHKTVQARILKYAQEIGWTFVPREDAEARRGFDPDASPKDRAKGASLFFDELLDIKVRQFNSRYSDAKGRSPADSAICMPTSTVTGSLSITCVTGANTTTMRRSGNGI